MNKALSITYGLLLLTTPLLPSNILFRVALIVGMAGFVVHLISGQRILAKKAELAMLLFIIWTITTILWTPSGRKAHELALDLLGVLMCFKMFTWVKSNRANKLTFGLFYVTGCAVASILIVRNWLNGIDFEGSGRYSVGDYMNANYAAYSIALGFAVACYIAWKERKNRFRVIFLVILMIIFVFALLLTGNRGSLLSCMISAFVVLNGISRGSILRRITLNAAAVIAIIIAAILIPTEHYSRFLFESYDDSGAGYSTGRLDMWMMAWERRGNILFGQGFDSFGALTGLDINPHNIVVSLTFEVGLLGLGLYVTTLWNFVNTSTPKGMVEGRLKWLPLYLFVGWLPIALTGVWGLAPVAWLIFSWARSVSMPRRALPPRAPRE